jgi:hypothetical protein
MYSINTLSLCFCDYDCHEYLERRSQNHLNIPDIEVLIDHSGSAYSETLSATRDYKQTITSRLSMNDYVFDNTEVSDVC